jgi:ribosomal protein S25
MDEEESEADAPLTITKESTDEKTRNGHDSTTVNANGAKTKKKKKTKDDKHKKHKKRDKKQENGEVPDPVHVALEGDASEVTVAKNNDALNYLTLFTTNRTAWKFNKRTSIYLLNNIYNPLVVPDDFFGKMVEYCVGMQGMSRTRLLQAAKDMVDTKEQHDKHTYKRAKEIIRRVVD